MNAFAWLLASVAVALNQPVAVIEGNDNCKLCYQAFDLKTPVEVPPDATVDITLKCDRGGEGLFAWRSETMPGFATPQAEGFAILGDGEYHTYQLRPLWGITNRLKSVRIDFPHHCPTNPPRVRSVRSIELVRRGPAPFPATAADGVIFRMKSDTFKYLSLNWQVAEPGKTLVPFYFGFTSIPDGREHVLWFDLKNTRERVTFGKPHWYGEIVSFGFREHLSSREFWPDGVEFVKGVPRLPADPVVRQVYSEEAIPRTGRPLPIEIVVRNYGTEPTEDVRFALEGLPEGVWPIDKRELAPKGVIAPSAGYDYIRDDYMPKGLPNERRFRITLSDPGRAVEFQAKLVLTARGGMRSEKSFTVKVLPSLGLAECDYPPEPKPVDTGDLEIGAIVFPGWTRHQYYPAWDATPEVRPLYGWYDDTSPEVRDWQIKHLVENGISFVVVDWYTVAGQGPKNTNYWIESFRKARYRKYLKYTILWCNEGTYAHSVEDQRILTRYWIENLFNDPQFLKIDGKPVVIMYNVARMEQVMGKGGAAKLMELSRQMAREAGYPGIYFMSVRHGNETPEYLSTLRPYSLDATCVYIYTTQNSPAWVGKTNGTFDFSAVSEASLTHWRTLRKNHDLPFWPALSTGTSNFPWMGDRGRGTVKRTPEKFAKICRDAKTFAAESGLKRLLMGPLDEWCEGEIGWPNAEHGFGMLESVREAFAKKPPEGFPLNYGPQDVGLGPYTKPEARIAPPDEVAPREQSDAEKMNATAMNRKAAFEAGGQGGKYRVLIYGNSILKHLPALHLGWTNDWGMAASAREKDFAHLLLGKMEAKLGSPVDYRLRSLHTLERGYKDYDVKSRLADDIAFNPDYVIIAIGENARLPKDDLASQALFQQRLIELARAFQAGGRKPRIVFRTTFWPNPIKTRLITAAARATGARIADAGPLGKVPENHAYGLFTHKGVAGHPGDLGMAAIADLIFEQLFD